MKQKRFLRLAPLIYLLLTLCTACTVKNQMEPVQLTVFAASSLTECLSELGERYMAAHPDVCILYNFDSSGTLKTQIQEGAECDIFISAGKKQMDQLDITAERFDILENKVALVVADGNENEIGSFSDLTVRLRTGDILLAIGNEDVPVGQYTQHIFEYFGLAEEELAASGVLTYGSNVKEVTTQVKEGLADCGIIYQTDACSAGLTVVDTATEEMCGRVIYSAAVLSTAKEPDCAKHFLHYLAEEEADGVFRTVGFTTIG